MKSKIFRILLLSSAVLLLVFSSAWSAMELAPRFTLSQEYNDNIFLTESNRESDWITTLEPGLSFGYDHRSLQMTLDYALRYRFFKNNTSEDQDRFRDIQRGAADLLFFSGRPFTLRTTGTITRETINERDRDLEYNDTRDRSTVYRLSLIPEYYLRIGPTMGVVFGYTLNLVDYVDRRGNDYLEHLGRVSINKSLFANLDVWSRYQYTYHDNDNNNEDYDRHEVSVGTNYRLGARTTLTAMIGRTKIDYDRGDETDRTIWSADVTYLFSPVAQGTLAYSQDFTMTAVNGLSKTREASFTMGYQPVFGDLQSVVFWRELDYVQLDRVDKSYGVRLRINRQLGRSLSASMDAGYERIDNKDPDPATDEKIHRYILGGSLNYEYRRIVTSLSYRYRYNDSDLSGRDYRNNIITLSGRLRF